MWCTVLNCQPLFAHRRLHPAGCSVWFLFAATQTALCCAFIFRTLTHRQTDHMLQSSSHTAGPQDEGSHSQSSDEDDQMLTKAPRTSLKSWDHSSPSTTLTGDEDKNQGCLLQMGGHRRPPPPSARSSSPPLHHLTSTTISRHIRHPTTADKVPSGGPLWGKLQSPSQEPNAITPIPHVNWDQVWPLIGKAITHTSLRHFATVSVRPPGWRTGRWRVSSRCSTLRRDDRWAKGGESHF